MSRAEWNVTQMSVAELDAAVAEAKAETREALQAMYNALNHGQQKQIVKDTKVKALFDLYGVDYGEVAE